MSLPNDQFGRTITMVTTGGEDVYTADDGQGNVITVSFPTGTAQSQVYNSLNGQAPPGWTPPQPLLSQSLTAQEFGQYVIDQFNNYNQARGLTDAQNLQLAETLSPLFELAMIGDLPNLLYAVQNLTVDGTLITTELITQFSTLIQGYLNGTI
jgi:hypothetical protein